MPAIGDIPTTPPAQFTEDLNQTDLGISSYEPPRIELGATIEMNPIALSRLGVGKNELDRPNLNCLGLAIFGSKQLGQGRFCLGRFERGSRILVVWRGLCVCAG